MVREIVFSGMFFLWNWPPVAILGFATAFRFTEPIICGGYARIPGCSMSSE